MLKHSFFRLKTFFIFGLNKPLHFPGVTPNAEI